MSPKIRKYLTSDNIIFSIFVTILISYFLFQSFYLKTDSPQVAVTTTSMVPTYNGFDISYGKYYRTYDILRGDLLIVQKKPVSVGDTIVFQLDNQEVAIVHRVIAEKTINNEKFYATKGDNNDFSDISRPGNDFGWISEKYVKGVVIFSIHNIGWFSLELQNSLIRLLLIFAMISIIAIGVLDYYNKKNTEKKESITESMSKPRKRIYLRLRNKKFQISRPKSFVFLFFMSLILTNFLIGASQYSNGSNNVNLLRKDDSLMENSIDLSNVDVEDYSTTSEDFFILNFKINISSNGLLNWVNRIEIRVIYDGYNNDYNPSYIWTIVYDFSGTKLIKAALIFMDIGVSQPIDSFINVKIYSSGILAQQMKEISVPIEVTFP